MRYLEIVLIEYELNLERFHLTLFLSFGARKDCFSKSLSEASIEIKEAVVTPAIVRTFWIKLKVVRTEFQLLL